MKTHVKLSALLMFICSLYSDINWAHDHGRGHYGGGHYGGRFGHVHPGFGFYFGGPLYNPYYNYPYYPPAVVAVPTTPPVYIQQSAPPAQQQYPAGYWYFCNRPEGYYPYVKECPSGWQQVEPTPPLPR